MSASAKSKNGKKAVAYVYLEFANNRWAREKAVELDQTFSYVIDRCLESYRKGEPLKLEKRIPFGIKIAEEAKKKRIEKLQALA